MKYPLLLSILCLGGGGGASASPPAGSVVCLTADQCERQFDTFGLSGYFYTGPSYPEKGCFLKNQNVYFGTEGSEEEMATTDLRGVLERVWCDEETESTTTTSPTTTTSEATSSTVPATSGAATTEAGGSGSDATSSTTPTTEAASTEATSTTAPTTEAASTEATSTTVPATEAASTEATSTTAPVTETASTEATSTTVPATEAASTEATSTTVPATEAASTASIVDGSTNDANESVVQEPIFLDVVDFEGTGNSDADSVPATEAAKQADATEAAGADRSTDVPATEAATTVPATEAVTTDPATEATEANGSAGIDGSPSTVPATEAATQTKATDADRSQVASSSAPATVAATEDSATEAAQLPACPAAYDMAKSTYARYETVGLESQIFACADTFYCNIGEWDDALLEVNPNAKALWDTAWVLLGPCTGGPGSPAAIETIDDETASRDEPEIAEIAPTATDELDDATTSPTSLGMMLDSSTKPADEKGEGNEEGEGGTAKGESDKKPEESGKQDAGKDSGKGGPGGKDQGKGKNDGNKGKGGASSKGKDDKDSKSKGQIVENKLLAPAQTQEQSEDKKLWIVGAVFGGLCAALLGMYALKRRRNNRVDEREYDGSFPQSDEVPPVTSVAWGEDAEDDPPEVVNKTTSEENEEAITGRSRHSESRYTEDPSSMGTSQMESTKASLKASDFTGPEACMLMFDCV